MLNMDVYIPKIMRYLITEQLFPLSGMVLLAWAYFLAYRDARHLSSMSYIWMNIVGAAILSAYAIHRAEPMFFLIELFWMVTSVLSLVRLLRMRK
jgi:hypothetical protein